MKLLIAVLVLVSASFASAQTRIVSIDAFDFSYTGGILIKKDNAKSGDDYEETTFKLNLNYAQAMPEYVGLMWKAMAFWNREDIDYQGDSLNNRFGAAGGFLYNFQAEDIKNSFLAGSMAGIERQTLEVNGRDDEAGFNFFVLFEGGKRFDMGSYASANISYAPTLSFQWKRYGGDIRDELFKTGTELKINFLKFDILF